MLFDLTCNAFSRQLVHFGACRNHSHGLVVNNQNSPFHLARRLVMIPDGGTDDIVHDFCKYKNKWGMVM